MTVMYDHDYLLVGGERRNPSSARMTSVASPASGLLIGRAPLAGEDDVDAAVAAARAAFDHGPWPRMSHEDRRAILQRAADILDDRAVEINTLASHENGGLARNRGGYMGPRVRYLASIRPPGVELRTASNGEQAAVVHEPVGVVAAIVPWNSPIPISVTKVVSALVAGCPVVLKPAPETPLSAYPLAEAFMEAGLPPGVLSVVAADRKVSEYLVRHPGVDHVSFTGGTKTGRHVAAICADSIKRVHLELGGKSAVIVLDDADLRAVAPAVLGGGMLLNNGQACCAWTRILVSRRQHDELVDALADVVHGIRVGDPFDETVDLGPVISEGHRDRILGYVEGASQQGATVIRGEIPSELGGGWYVAPTVLANSTNDMTASREEIFGPVVSVISYDDDAHAVAIANDSEYGLSAAVFTGDQRRGTELAGGIRSGTVSINSLGFNIEFPFGGYKQSGVGRQHGPEGVAEHLETKTISVAAGADAPVVSPNQRLEATA